MPDDTKGKAFPDVSAKLSALPKKSLFERQKADAEAKRAREKAETAAVYEDFVKSFEDDVSEGPRASDGRPNTFGGRGGAFGGGPPRRHFTNSGPRSSGPGSLGPPPPSLSRKRPHEGPSDDEDDRSAEAKEAERAAARPTLYLSSLPPGTSPSVLKSLISSPLVVGNVHILRPQNQSPTERKSVAAIITLASDSAASDIDSAETSAGHHHQAHIVGALHPPSSYGPNLGRIVTATQVEVKAPADVKQLRLIHKTLENLLNHGPEFEALLMSRPEVQREEKWAWIWDARSPGGVYYRWKLWQVITNPRSHGNRKSKSQQPSSVFEDGASWIAPERDIKFEFTTRLDEIISDEDYNSSDEEQSDGEEEKRNLGGAPPPEGGNGPNDGLGYMNPLQKAKLTHLLARLPTTHARLRRGDIARITAFAIEHAGLGADEVVDMIVLNILSPLAYTGANPNRDLENDAANRESHEKDNDNPSKGKMDLSAAKLVGLYTISDILSSSATSGVRHAWRYRQLFESALRSHKVFEHLGRLEKDLHWGRLKAEKWKRSVGTLLHLWEGWCVFPQSSHEHFVQVFEQPPLTDEELQKEKEKAEIEQASNAFSKKKNRWKTVDDEDPGSSYFDQSGPSEIKKAAHQAPVTAYPAEDESMSDIDGVPMEDSDLEMPDEEEPTEEESMPRDSDAVMTQPPGQPEDITGHQDPEPERREPVSRRPRKPRPKAEDMFASDSDIYQYSIWASSQGSQAATAEFEPHRGHHPSRINKYLPPQHSALSAFYTVVSPLTSLNHLSTKCPTSPLSLVCGLPSPIADAPALPAPARETFSSDGQRSQQFVEFYYQTFDSNRSGLAPLYVRPYTPPCARREPPTAMDIRDQSMLTFETSSVQGTAGILEKLTSLPFQQVRHQIATLDAQPSSEGGIAVLVTGGLIVDEESKPMSYTQCFNLQPDGQGSFFVLNDIFRLIYAA
ncbi:hypothetical protein N7533_007073 [Penicillium manginii]|uniref:uncharacterized protein n=1 Tax=Penicillium manginii TaxID=203109 RepID=UPI002549AC95|nr:uncharacterized protein N7533_007073 [Penicillium manginii]KAJ5750045.1 hypothetical protein N7533_007073 [Penicillium manginii]